MKKIISIPNAARTFEALRSLGYDLNSSVADLLDNCLTENVSADEVRITFIKENKKIKIRIHDNGSGMSEPELEEAMRIGTDTNYAEEDLGKFGMGMKTASLSHCNVLTVVSKKSYYKTTGYRWDLNHVNATNDGWVLFQLTESEIDDVLISNNIQLNTHGTIVLWDDLFHLNEEYKSYTNETLAGNFFFRIGDELRRYLSMIFHRFLEKHKLSIKINDEKLVPWDPFSRKEEKTVEVALPSVDTHFKIKANLKPVVIKAYVLPTKETFSSETAWRNAKGLLSWNDSQGYYIYRADRIIRFGGWQNTRAKDEHDKLARISIDIPPSLDQFFRITVNKTRVQFPESLFNHLKNNINQPVSKQAQKQYRKSPENRSFKNKFRAQESKLSNVSKSFIQDKGITTKQQNIDNNVYVSNPNGTWLVNRMAEFLKYGSNKDFEVVSGKVEDGHVWKIVCGFNEKIKVVVNENHSFYKKIYSSSATKNITNAIDALILSLAFAELYNRNAQNENLFSMFKSVSSEVLENLITKEIL